MLQHLVFYQKNISYDDKVKGNLIPYLPGYQVDGWNLIRLARVWLLLQIPQDPKEECIKNIETLFDTAELNELVALYSALPLLPYPWEWLSRATDAVRSNMGFVFDAISLLNPYPELYFPESAWNQLVLKTIFNGKPIHLIYGLDRRKNKELAISISDFIDERFAAGRKILRKFCDSSHRFQMRNILLLSFVCWHLKKVERKKQQLLFVLNPKNRNFALY